MKKSELRKIIRETIEAHCMQNEAHCTESVSEMHCSEGQILMAGHCVEAHMIGQGKRIIPEIEDALNDYFPEFEVMAVEMPLFEPITDEEDYNFKGYIDAVVATPDGKIHIFDWKTCSWGWDSRKKSEKMVTYQLTLYKHFFCQKHGIDPSKVETHFALLKRKAKKDFVEIFSVTSGPRKTTNATERKMGSTEP